MQPEAVGFQAEEQLRGERARKPEGYSPSSHSLRMSWTGILAEVRVRDSGLGSGFGFGFGLGFSGFIGSGLEG